ncbi:MAG: gluconokinase [Bacteroidota bacterium]
MVKEKRVLIIMGVSGTGKSTIGQLLSEHLEIPFFDGDDFHPKENVVKMSAGKPLNDEDRKGWLMTLNQLAKKQPTGAVIACSALKEKYRQLLRNGLEDSMVFIHLEGSFELIKSRLERRKGHFMPLQLLQSQFDTLEAPSNAITVSVSEPPENILQNVLTQLKT